MIDIDNNEDFLVVHKARLESHFGPLKNKDDWRILSIYKNII